MSALIQIYKCTVGKRFRVCLASIYNNSNECHEYQLQSVMSQHFAIFPQASAFIQPSKRAFYYPSFWNNRKFVSFVSFCPFNFCTACGN